MWKKSGRLAEVLLSVMLLVVLFEAAMVAATVWPKHAAAVARPTPFVAESLEADPEPQGSYLDRRRAELANLPAVLSYLPTYEELALWPAGFTGAFYRLLDRVRLLVWWVSPGIPLPSGLTYASCFFQPDGPYIVYIVRDYRYYVADYASCIPHEAGHAADWSAGWLSASSGFQHAVLLTEEDLTRFLADPQPAYYETWMDASGTDLLRYYNVLDPSATIRWKELYAEMFTWVTANYRRMDIPMLEAVPPRLRPYYAEWMPDAWMLSDGGRAGDWASRR